jgi:ribonuclease E
MNSGFDGSVPEMDEADLAAPADDEDPDDQPLVAERDARTAPSARHEPRGEGRGDERQMESGSDGKRRRRRRRGRRGRDEDQRGTPPPAAGAESDPRDGEAVDRFDEETDDQPTVTADAFPTSGQRPAADDVPGDDDQPELINGDGEDQPSLTPPSGEIDDRRRRRRGRRGGRQRRERDETGRIEADGRLPAAEEVATIEIVAAPPVLRDSPTPAADTPAAPMAMAERAIEPSPATAVASVPVTAEPHSAPVVAVEPLPPKPEPLLAPLVVSDAPARPAKSGWWRRG